MSELVFESEALNGALGRGGASREEAQIILHDALKDPRELYNAASLLRDHTRGSTISFSKKAFFNLTDLCRDSCAYCTYKSAPASAVMMDRKDVGMLARLARENRCVEALFVTGERPEEKYPQARAWLRKNGHTSTAGYLAECSEIALEAGLFPHTNAGNLERAEMKELSHTNASLGLMLENTSPRLAEKGGPHHLAPSKDPIQRKKVLRDAGYLGIPVTTGLLLGIGERPEEALDSLFAIRDLHIRYHNIQEIIIQNFMPKPYTAMAGCAPAGIIYFKIITALARIIMPDANIQIPPNLSPESYMEFLDMGINDWGGISPLTADYVNPEFAWPRIDELESGCASAGRTLRCRFPVYPEFMDMAHPYIRDRMAAVSDEGYVAKGYWR